VFPRAENGGVDADIEERVRVMLYQPATWARLIALAPEIARRLYRSGAEIEAFLAFVDVTRAVSPKGRAWTRTEYTLGQEIGVLDVSCRARGALAHAEIATMAQLLTYSGRDVREATVRTASDHSMPWDTTRPDDWEVRA
jgi:hypothetical protein